MMTPDQSKTVRRAYNHLISHENRGWDDLDDFMDYLEYLNDDELHREADVLLSSHANANVRCHQDHDPKDCFIPLLIEAVGSILDLYKETGLMHAKNKYVVQYYLAMNQANMIKVDNTLMKS